MSAVL